MARVIIVGRLLSTRVNFRCSTAGTTSVPTMSPLRFHLIRPIVTTQEFWLLGPGETKTPQAQIPTYEREYGSAFMPDTTVPSRTNRRMEILDLSASRAETTVPTTFPLAVLLHRLRTFAHGRNTAEVTLMDILETVKQMLSACGLPLTEICIDASLFRSDGSRTNIGLINAEALSIQIHVNKVMPGGYAEETSHLERPSNLTLGSGTSDHNRQKPPRLAHAGPRIIEKQLFDVRNVFRFNPDFVFDEKMITINTIPIYFIRKGRKVLCDIKVRNVTLCTEIFSIRHGEPSMSEEVFHRCERPDPYALCFKSYDRRLSRLISFARGQFYRNGGDLLICVFPTSPRKTLPLGSDDGVFPPNRFGPVILVCVARPHKHNTATYRIRSHFYVVSENEDPPRKETPR